MYKIAPLQNGLENIDGFYFGGLNSGFKKVGNDLGFIRADEPFAISAIFTSNKFAAAPIAHFRRILEKNGGEFRTNFILINSKNANAMTGEAGIGDIDEIFSEISKFTPLVNPVMSSTGVIGYRLKKEKIIAAAKNFDLMARDSEAIATAIMTTDTLKKEFAYEVSLENGEKFHIAGICKGAGMINPALATMLCYILTDAKIPHSDMGELLSEAVEDSFNRVSVDGDTSTNDTVMLATSARASYDKEAFRAALKKIALDLALMLVRDGEGANKLVKFRVFGAKNDNEAKKAAKALSNSPLVKTAIYGEDPNWGRIASTIGACGIECDAEKLVIKYDDALVYDSAHRELDEERERLAHEVMQKAEFEISCDLGLGAGEFSAYGCDLSYEYVKINADYRS
ncbi:bifunctional glutamate N-acetyltransferase/amino-acid acetyltransferase ArgJ [Campylobacter sp. JMF_01 NE2]|uniref:bifunctional glutamate N-acetyltransferase/amino-acid acetyltransferase ArgJ n=1 Tax=unclassified Campylobacter TaxID=2593542 RepID=UPI0022E9E8F3|nr:MULTISPECIES: bifunctional glutamate N-acetyltransferase/amino-acid acetyltransferase ArgJ [unclassified Campylobacter]MDA3053002.1 bifunctional glutamate N-acetyltransferase/amino-acid acetyltransferase ArgJ [Campylobacter sp. JMF_03 NE3]MDA3067333.1 bifunctional glutamate N-acetyltransferase/amino-acid acetyltransferase ArgJ [Campylobacter sp. JMF_01 NE2]